MAQARMPEKKKRNLKENHGSNLASERQNRGETFDICRKKSIGQKNDLCALLAGIGHTVKITIFALEKSKSRKVHMPGDFGSKSRKNRKIRKVEKSKNSNNSKNSKSRKLFGFLTFCENFPWKSDKPRGVLEALEHRQYPRTGLFMVVWLLFPGRMVGYFPGEQETCNQSIRIRFGVAHVISGFLYFFVLILWVLKAGY